MRRLALLLAFCAGLLAGATLSPAGAQERAASCDVGQLHEQLTAAGLPVRSVRCPEVGRVEVILRDGATREQIAAARAVEAAVARGDAGVTVAGRSVDLQARQRLSLLDALAVLQVDAQDAAARAVVEAHVARVRQR